MWDTNLLLRKLSAVLVSSIPEAISYTGQSSEKINRDDKRADAIWFMTNDYDYIQIALSTSIPWFFIVQLAYVYSDLM